MVEFKRKGALRMADIPPAVLKRLNRGKIEAVTLAEVLAVDMAELLKNAFPDLDKNLLKRMKQADELGWLERTRIAGELLYTGLGKKSVRKALAHPSDQVRGWAASALRAIPDMDIEERLELVRPLADDTNAGARETAWIMLRPFVAQELKRSIKILKPWVRDAKPNIRRYATEITRPRGVWCAHITALRQEPEIALSLLSLVNADPSRYVQNSVANWLNDASKDNPKWVRGLCRDWLRESSTKETAYICKRAQRTLDRK